LRSHNHMTKTHFAFCFLALALAISPQALALKSDRDQPAQIEADETEIDFKTGVRTLTRNVLVVQGTLRIKADKLVATYDKKGQLVKAVANGSLARFKQRPDDQPDDVEGWGKKIVVDYPTNTLTLIGKAALKQGATTATGSEIVYNMATDKLKIKGGSNFNTPGKDGKGKPVRKIEDPFKDDNQGQGPAQAVRPVPKPTTPKPASTELKAESADEQVVEQVEKVAPRQIEPAKAGRSRLILQPKKVKKKDKKRKKDGEGDKES